MKSRDGARGDAGGEQEPLCTVEELLEQADAVASEAYFGNYSLSSYEELLKRANQVARINDVASSLPDFIISQLDGRYAQGRFELGLRDDLGMDIRRWPELG